MSSEPNVVLSLHGLIAIAVRDAGPGDLRAIRRQLGPLPEIASAGVPDPEIVIRFVDRLAVSGTLRQLGLDAAFDDEHFFVLRGRRKTAVRVQLPVDRLGTMPFEIVAERGRGAVPYLLPALHATLLAKGVLPLHASAFVHDGVGVLVTGWAKGGKSEALLAYADRGARYVGDEWVFVTADGSQMGGLPEPMRLWDWQLAMVPAAGKQVGIAGRARLRAAAGLAVGLGGASRLPVIRSSPVGDVARRSAAVVERQRSIQVPPARLFGSRIADGLVPLDRVILIESSDDPSPSVRPIAAEEVARRTAATVAHELLDLNTVALAYSFAFPGRRPAFVDEIAGRLERGLGVAIADVPCFLVRHPYPPDIPGLAVLIDPVIASPR
jgi:hypothetical protein